MAFAVLAVPPGAACAFFAYYTIRLAYVNVTSPNTAGHRQAGMYIGAVAFPVASVLFGLVCRRCIQAARRAARDLKSKPPA